MANAPLFRDAYLNIHPIESVFATMEVKYTLERRQLPTILADIGKIRAMKQHKYYVKWDDKNGRLLRKEYTIDLAPQSYLFAYGTRDFSSIKQLQSVLEELLQKTSAHLHGIIVLEQDWFLQQLAFKDNPPLFLAHADQSLLRFFNSVLEGISTVPMQEMSTTRYTSPEPAPVEAET